MNIALKYHGSTLNIQQSKYL